MRGSHNTDFVAFRAPPQLVAALAERAEKAGCSTSEYLRHVVREKVGLN